LANSLQLLLLHLTVAVREMVQEKQAGVAPMYASAEQH
jgi:hypothetical protein